MTLTEKRMVRMWAAAAHTGDWYELNRILWEISRVLDAEGIAQGAEVFSFLAGIALQRAVDETTARKMRVAA